MAADGPGAIRRALDKARAARRALTRFAPRPSAFAPAPDAEAAAVRAVRNLRTFRFHYAVLQWALLLASLAPRHRASMLFLMAASKGLLLYGALLKAFPNSALLRRLLDRRLVAALFLALVLADITASGAIANLLAALAAGVPLILLHAAFRVRDDLLEPAQANGGGGDEEEKATVVVVEKKEDGDAETGPTRRSMAAAPRSPNKRSSCKPHFISSTAICGKREERRWRRGAAHDHDHLRAAPARPSYVHPCRFFLICGPWHRSSIWIRGRSTAQPRHIHELFMLWPMDDQFIIVVHAQLHALAQLTLVIWFK